MKSPFKTTCGNVAQTATYWSVKQKTIRARVDRKTKDKLVKKAAKESSSESRLVRLAVLNYLIEK